MFEHFSASTKTFSLWLRIATLVGQLSGIYTELGLDTVCPKSVYSFRSTANIVQAAHMSEEVRDAARPILKAIISVYIINFNFCLIFPAELTVYYYITSIDDTLTVRHHLC